MMVSPGLEQETFKTFLDALFNKMDPADPLHKMRLKAKQRTEEIGLPSKKTEVYRYVKLRHLYAQNFVLGEGSSLSSEQVSEFVLPECTNSFLVFINGHFQEALSIKTAIPSKVVISTLNHAARTYGTLLNNHVMQSLKEETDAFVALNAALHPEGAFVYIPPKTIVEAPIQILHFITTECPAVLLPRIHVFVGAQSQACFVATNHDLGSGLTFGHLKPNSTEDSADFKCPNVRPDPRSFANQVTDFVLEEDAHVNYVQNLSEIHADSWYFDAVRAQLKRHATFKSTCVTAGSATVRTDYRVALVGENCEVFLNGISMLENKNESHVNVFIDHQAPHCRSNQLFKYVLNDFSRSSFEGKIMVRQAAQKTEAFQLNNNLVLSDYAHADSKPNLEIFADDVKATHGATVGQLDAEQLFYMKTRGFSETTAKNLLIFGFCEEVIERIPVKSIKADLSAKARK